MTKTPDALTRFLPAGRSWSDIEHDTEALRALANRVLQARAGDSRTLLLFAKKWLGAQQLFAPAAKILELALAHGGAEEPETLNQLRQQLAVATYKNEEAPPRRRLMRALQVLDACRPLAHAEAPQRDTDQAETLALYGAVYRRLWDLDGRGEWLRQALDHYRKSAQLDFGLPPSQVTGYGALNAAFLLDALAFHLESLGSGDSPARVAAAGARDEALALRRTLCRRLKTRLETAAPEDWIAETLAGALLALGLSALRTGDEDAEPLLADALHWCRVATDSTQPLWQRETTYSHWLRVVRLHEPQGGGLPALQRHWQAAAPVLDGFRLAFGGVSQDWRELAAAARRGKLGLALSGGGLRASFYHLGVLARLAEVDALRHVDALSTVSGGSIVGAHYYLLLKQLLETEAAPTREHYLQLVEKLIAQFSEGAAVNLRMRGLSNPVAWVKMLLFPSYTRSSRMAELYERQLFARTAKPGQAAVLRMADLRIAPGSQQGFNPRFGNWLRAARVPALMINATCLNTGHAWHFTANWMGEPPERIGETVDKNERLRRMAYKDAPGCQDLSLGFAVAASACVPGLFDPLRLPGVYPDRHVRLVDGGVHDNLGVDALVGQRCDVILCSDGSGQMENERRPGDGPMSTPARSLDILMKQVREASHAELAQRIHTGTQRGLFFVHLKAELPADDVDWKHCADPTPRGPRQPASYGIALDLQAHLAAIRTDLDVFSEVEQHALMASGYRMALAELERLEAERGGRDGPLPWCGLDLGQPTEYGRWSFLRLERLLATPADGCGKARADLGRQLAAGRRQFFRLPALVTPLRVALGGSALGALAWAGHRWHTLADGLQQVPAAPPWWAIGLATSAVAGLMAWAPARVRTLQVLLASVGFVLANGFFFSFANRALRARGRVKPLLDNQ